MQKKITSLNDFQRSFVKWAYSRNRGIAVAPPGAGKSLSIMAYFMLLRKHELASRMVVFTKTKAMTAFDKANVSHLSITKITSQKDFLNFYSGDRFYSDIYLISTTVLTGLSKFPNQVKKNFFSLIAGTGLLSIDEVHDYRNWKSSVTTVLRQVTNYYQKVIDSSPTTHRLFGITATPVYKALEDWHPIMALIEPRLFGTYFNFLDNYCIQNARNAYVGRRLYSANGTSHVKRSITFNEIVGYKNTEDLYKKLDPYLFQWKDTDFTFDYTLAYYDLNEVEQQRYQVALKGLGLDKEYAVNLKSNTGRFTRVYRDKNDIMYGPDEKPILVKDLVIGQGIIFNGVPHRVESVLEKKKDATHSVRLIKLQQTVSSAEAKLKLLLAILKKSPNGALVYFDYLDSVQTVHQFLLKQSLGKRIVVLTGKTPNLSSIVASLQGDEIVLASKVVKQSLDFYTDTFIVFEALSNPGLIEQACGRLTRYNSPYRAIHMYFLIRPLSIEEYFYNRLRLLLKHTKTNVYTGELPVSKSLDTVDPRVVDISYLKERFLWNKE